VWITSSVAGHEFYIGIEASRTARKADIEWVEQMISKHEDLPTDKLLLYSGSGFTKNAADKAARHNVGVISLTDATDDEHIERSILTAIAHADHAFIGITPLRIAVSVVLSDASLTWFWAPADMPLYFADGSKYELALLDCLMKLVDNSFDVVMSQVKQLRVTGQATKLIRAEWQPLTVDVDGQTRQLHGLQTLVRPPELHAINRVGLEGRLDIHGGTLSLSEGNLGGVRVAYGEVAAFGVPGVMVASDDAGASRVTVRLSDGRSSDLNVPELEDPPPPQ